MLRGSSNGKRRWLTLAARTAASILGAAFFIVAIAFAIWGKGWNANALVVAPNAGRSFRVEDDPLPGAVRNAGADEQLRVQLGPPDSVSLSVWLVEPKGPPLATVLVLHGIRSDKFWFVGLARKIAARGFRAVIPDLRGHGRSSGDWLSYGVREANDLSALLSELAKAGRLVEPVGVVGVSYGAATGIQLAGIDPRVRTVVAIAPFSSLDKVVPDYVRHYVPLLWRLIPDAYIAGGIEQGGVLAHFDPAAANPLAAMSRTDAQVLLIHGLADSHIPPEHSRRLHAVAAEHSELILVRGDDHFSINGDRTGAIGIQGMAWLQRWLHPGPSPGSESRR
jgi:pimeloyl-ACP methyl ester carboxylesterase